MKTQTTYMKTRTPLEIMRRAVRDEHENPLSRSAGPDWQAAISDYLSRGGEDDEPGELQQLFREACEEEGVEY